MGLILENLLIPLSMTKILQKKEMATINKIKVTSLLLTETIKAGNQISSLFFPRSKRFFVAPLTLRFLYRNFN